MDRVGREEGDVAVILSNRTQAGLVAQTLAGKTVTVEPSDLTGRWGDHWRWLEENPQAGWTEFLEHCSLDEGCLIDAREVRRQLDQPAQYEAVDQVIARLPELRWLWPGWIPMEMITIVAGDPGAGKSYLTLDLVHRWVVGGEWPDGRKIAGAGLALYVDAENRPALFKQRVRPWGDERGRLYYMLPAENRMMINLDGEFDQDRLLDRVYQIRPEMVILDSYGYATLKEGKNKEDVQRLLSFLNRIAQDYRCAMLVVHHLRKPQAIVQLSLPEMPMSIHEVHGSGFITRTATSVIGIKKMGASDAAARRVQVIKSNAAQAPEALGVTFSPWAVDQAVAVLHYGDAPDGEGASGVEQCAEWLLDLLEDGPVAVREIVEEGAEAGFGRRMVYRARERLGEDVVGGKKRAKGNEWRLRDYTEDEPEEIGD